MRSCRLAGLACQGIALAYQGEAGAARAAPTRPSRPPPSLAGLQRALAYSALALAALAAGDVATAQDASEAAWPAPECRCPRRRRCWRAFSAQAALAGGDLVAARRWADEAVTTTTGWYLSVALTTRARVAIAQGEPEQAERDAHDALACAAEIEAYLYDPGHPGMPRRSGRRRRQSPRSGPALRCGRGHPAAHGRGPLQDL